MQIMRDLPNWRVTTVHPDDLCSALWVRAKLDLGRVESVWHSPSPAPRQKSGASWKVESRDALAREWSKWWDALIERRATEGERVVDEGSWSPALPATSHLRTVLQQHEEEIRVWKAEYQVRMFEGAAVSVRHDEKIAGSLAFALQRHRPMERVELVIHAVSPGDDVIGSAGFVLPSQRCCVIWGDILSSQAAYDALVKGLTGTT